MRTKLAQIRAGNGPRGADIDDLLISMLNFESTMSKSPGVSGAKGLTNRANNGSAELCGTGKHLQLGRSPQCR